MRNLCKTKAAHIKDQEETKEEHNQVESMI